MYVTASATALDLIHFEKRLVAHELPKFRKSVIAWVERRVAFIDNCSNR